MIKEFILASTLGAILGFGITGSFIALTRNKTAPAPKTSQVTTSTVTDTTPAPIVSPLPSSAESPSSGASTINIISPQPNSIVANSRVTVNGSTAANSLITISTTTKVFTSTSNTNGDFSLDIELESGANILNITAVDPNDNQSDTQLLVTYSTAKI